MSMYPIFSQLQKQLSLTLFNTAAGNYFEPLLEKYFPEKSLVSCKAKVLDIKVELQDVQSITLRPSKKWKGFKPGQYVELGLKINGVLYHRPFSISSTVEQLKKEGTITLTIQQQFKGKVTRWMFSDLKKDMLLTLSEAKGEFSQKDDGRNLLFIAGGCGISPFVSMLEKAASEKQNVVMLYYAKSGKHLLKTALDKFSEHQNIHIQFISSTEHGRLTAAHLNTFCPDFNQRDVFICGPAAMISHCESVLNENGVNNQAIMSEYFKAAAFHSSAVLNGNNARLKLRNKTLEVKGNATVLEQLENNGIQPVYGCRMGICKQCQCAKKSGIVFNRLTGKFSESSSEMIQICVSIPVGEVEIDI